MHDEGLRDPVLPEGDVKKPVHACAAASVICGLHVALPHASASHVQAKRPGSNFTALAPAGVRVSRAAFEIVAQPKAVTAVIGFQE